MSGINPIQNSQNITKYVYYVERLFVVLVAVYGSVLAFQFMWILTGNYTDISIIRGVISLLVAAAAAFATDFAFRNFLTEALFWPWAILHPDIRTKIIRGDWFFSFMGFFKWALVTFGLVGGLFYLDWMTMQNSRVPIASAADGVEETDVVSETDRLNAEMAATLGPLSSRISELKNEIKADRSAVERNNPALVALIRKDNGWAKSELAKRQRSATKKKSAELEKLEAQYNERVGETTGVITASVASMGIKNAAIIAQNATLQSSISSMIFLYSGWLKVITIVCRMFLIVSFLADRRNNLDVNGDGRIDGKDVNAAALSGATAADFS